MSIPPRRAATIPAMPSTPASLLRYLSDLFKPAADREPPSPFFTSEEIGRLHRADLDPKTALDDQTWHDLLLASWEERLAQETSVYGRQLLHRRLRAGLPDADCAALSARLRGLLEEPERLDALDKALRPLRFAETEVAGLLFGGPGSDLPQPPWWSRLLWTLPLFLLLCLGLLATQPLGWMATLAALAPLMALQIRYHHRLELWKNTLESLGALLAGSHALAQLGGHLLEPFVEERAMAARLHGRIGRPLLLRMIPAGEAYMNWFAAHNVRRYWKTVRAVADARDFLRACYLRSAELEADVALARHLRRQETWCWAERSPARALHLQGGVHPLMEMPAPLSVSLDGQGGFISGQNASGKKHLPAHGGLEPGGGARLRLLLRRACAPACRAGARQHAERGFAAGRRKPVYVGAAPGARTARCERGAGRHLPGRRGLPRHQPPGIGVGRRGGAGKPVRARPGTGLVAQPGAGANPRRQAGAFPHR
ncbi:hypothetical protein MasN3_06260 [Massilia varians]|uniref:Uncharacterized protein n=1 Tax=Massilia varians TaxID=457921 RepID=A0ABN6T4L7_9BURK|nr:hypothetical protein MasN3_06260 [Massilia varians]